ncbi:hypothetical protein [Lamprobacter modestohalophilus]|uniref:hypothetical protein n=1 Tax=Lamprobacter modestohalophilus TaxID=1064514 RepID=UPI001906193A|nr:hypothetical protein [Lamprobacter modestohalophilus]
MAHEAEGLMTPKPALASVRIEEAHAHGVVLHRKMNRVRFRLNRRKGLVEDEKKCRRALDHPTRPLRLDLLARVVGKQAHTLYLVQGAAKIGRDASGLDQMLAESAD